MSHFHSFGGRIDQTAIIGHAPEVREWTPDQPTYAPIIGEGVRIEAFVTVDAGLDGPTTIGARTWLCKHVHVGHDVVIGEDCELTPGTVIGGYAVIGDGVRFGIGALVLPRVTLGSGVRVGAGAVVTKDYAAGVLVGNPARRLDG